MVWTYVRPAASMIDRHVYRKWIFTGGSWRLVKVTWLNNGGSNRLAHVDTSPLIVGSFVGSSNGNGQPVTAGFQLLNTGLMNVFRLNNNGGNTDLAGWCDIAGQTYIGDKYHARFVPISGTPNYGSPVNQWIHIGANQPLWGYTAQQGVSANGTIQGRVEFGVLRRDATIAGDLYTRTISISAFDLTSGGGD